MGRVFGWEMGFEITVLKIDNNAVRIGIEAPDDVPIRRQEIAFELPEPLSKEAAEYR